MQRIGGLIIMRKMTEAIQLRYKGLNRLVKFEKINPDGSAHISLDGQRYDLFPNDSIGLDGDAIYLENIEGGRVALRLIMSDDVRILRSELLR
jgi:hypothetical protein